MSSSTDIAVIPAVAQLRAAVNELVELPLWQLSEAAAADLLAELEHSARLLAFAGVRVIADIDARDIAQKQAAVSTTEFLRRRLLISPSEAKGPGSGSPRIGRIDCTVRRDDSASLAGDRGRGGDWRDIAGAGARDSRALEKLPTGLTPELRTTAETQLAKHAYDLDPAQLTVAARRIHTILDPDGMLDTDQPARRELTFIRDTGGCDVLRGRLDTEGAAIVRTAIDAISAPEPAENRSPARRRADGLIELCRRFLDSGALPAQGGEKPHLTVTLHWPDLTATLNDQPITAAHARRLACDASVIPAVLGTRGEPLDIGRASRTIPPAIRRALTIRDKGCVHAGCAKPPEWCDAHHVRSWLDGGPTALNNLVLLCGKHHRTIHHTEWKIVFPQGIPHLVPPPLIDPQQRPQRNLYFCRPSQDHCGMLMPAGTSLAEW